MGEKLGKFRATVHDVNDPNKQGRVKLKIPSVLGEVPSNWAIPVCPYYSGDDVGMWGLPDVGDNVWVEFEEGHTDRPLLVGSWWSERKTPIKEYNEADYQGKEYKEQLKRRRFKTKKGHIVEINDIDGDERILIQTKEGNMIEMRDPRFDGTEFIEIKDYKGNSIKIDSKEDDIIIKALNKINIEADLEVNIKAPKINLN